MTIQIFPIGVIHITDYCLLRRYFHVRLYIILAFSGYEYAEI